jgi:hypothetical protein
LDQAADEFNRICAEQFGGVDPDLSDSDLATLAALEQEEGSLYREALSALRRLEQAASAMDLPPYLPDPTDNKLRYQEDRRMAMIKVEQAPMMLGWKAVEASGG